MICTRDHDDLAVHESNHTGALIFKSNRDDLAGRKKHLQDKVSPKVIVMITKVAEQLQ